MDVLRLCNTIHSEIFACTFSHLFAYRLTRDFNVLAGNNYCKALWTLHMLFRGFDTSLVIRKEEIAKMKVTCKGQNSRTS